MSYEIKFGTDGWRAVISDGFTFPNVKRVAQAACDVIRKTSKSRLILIGFDRRFYSQQFAQTAAHVACANGFRVEISEQPLGSPALSFQVHDRKAAVGFMITASHNPYQFNGFKLKGSHGGSVDEAITNEVENRIDVGEIQYDEDGGKKTDFIGGYVSWLKKHVKPTAVNSLKGPVVFDSLHGPGGEIFEKFIGKSDKVKFIRKEQDPLFGGVNPEPIEVNLQALKDAVLQSKAAIGIAVDGDADRVGIIDDKGRYLPPHVVMPLILLHLVENKKLKGKVVQTLSMGYVTERVAKKFSLPFEEVSVGFKYIAKKMGSEKVLLGGEESGGYGVGLWAQERDGILCGMLLVELLAASKKPLSTLVDELASTYGASHFKRVDITLKKAINKQAWTQHVSTLIGKPIAGLNIKSVNSSDGIKVILEDDSWFLMRPSGTEPLLRTYAESAKPETVQSLLTEAQRLATTPPPTPKKSSSEGKSKSKKAMAAR